MRTIPAFKELFGHAWWLDCLIILGILTLCFIIGKLGYKGYKQLQKWHNKKKDYQNLDHAGQQSAQTVINRLSQDLGRLDPPLIMDDGGAPSGHPTIAFNASGGLGDPPLPQDWRDVEQAMALPQVQQMMHSLQRSQNSAEMLPLSDFAASTSVASPPMSSANLSHRPLQSRGSSSLLHPGHMRSATTGSMNTVVTHHSLNTVGTDMDFDDVHIDAQGNVSVSATAAKKEDEKEEKLPFEEELQMGQVMSDMSGWFTQLKNTVDTSGALGRERMISVTNDIADADEDSDGTEDSVNRDLKSSLRLAGMSSVVLSRLVSGRQHSISRTSANGATEAEIEEMARRMGFGDENQIHASDEEDLSETANETFDGMTQNLVKKLNKAKKKDEAKFDEIKTPKRAKSRVMFSVPEEMNEDKIIMIDGQEESKVEHNLSDDEVGLVEI